MPSSCGVSLSLSLTEDEVAPGRMLHGEVRVTVSSRHKKGVIYEAIRLVFLAVERSCVWDDQGEFDALLNEYTSSRVYLDRHVTLAGFKTQTEDSETTGQAREEMLFLQHSATPYAAVAPTKPKQDAFRHYTRGELMHGDIPMAAPTTHATGGAVTYGGSPDNNIGAPYQEPMLDCDNPHCAAAAPGQRPAVVRLPVLMPGTHRFPFMFRLPPWLPPSFYYSFVGAKGQLKYSASATMLFPSNGAHFWRHSMCKGFSESARDTKKPRGKSADVSKRSFVATMLPHCGHAQGATPSGEAELSQLGYGRPLYMDIDEDGAPVVEHTRQYLSGMHLFAPSDLTVSSYFDVLSVMPRRQLVAEYYQIDTHNIHQRSVDFPQEVRSAGGAGGGSEMEKPQKRPCKFHDGADVKSPDVTSGLAVGREDTHLALSALYQTFRFGWLANMCCLQPQNALEAEVLVVGARTVLLGDEVGALQALGVRPPTITDYAPLGGSSPQAPGFLAPGLAVAAPNTPWPVRGVTLRVLVRNHCPTHTVRCVRVELKVMVEIFKSLKTPHTFPGLCYSSYDHTMPIPPGSEAVFDVRLALAPRFRRHETDSEELLPPPGVRTANMTSNTFVEVSFPGMCTYVEEEEKTKSVVIMAETVDLNDEVLELPLRYS